MSSDSGPVKGFRPLFDPSSGQPSADSNKNQEATPGSDLYPYTPSRPSPADNMAAPSAPNSPPQSWQAPTPVQPVHQVPVYQGAGPNPNTAYLIELIGGLFGFFGLGYIYGGQTGPGTIRLVLGILCNVVLGVIVAITAGIAACVFVPAYIIVAVLSANSIKTFLLNQHQSYP